MKIIDVSHHQGIIDWDIVRKQDVNGVIVRAGYGKGNVDRYFTRNFGSVRGYDFPYVGVYWFSYAYTIDMAIREAEIISQMMKPYMDMLNLGVYFDWEYDSMQYMKKNGVNPNKTLITNMNLEFCRTVAKNGFIAGYYLNEDYKKNWIDVSRLKDYRQWYARYSSKAKPENAYLHQYSSQGKVKGIAGYVDMNKLLAPKTVYEVACEVLAGEWGNGVTRKNKLESAGYNYREVQDMVNSLYHMQITGF